MRVDIVGGKGCMRGVFRFGVQVGLVLVGTYRLVEVHREMYRLGHGLRFET